jgi:arylsulfatase A-like enzyme
MTSRERTLRAITFGQPDRLPLAKGEDADIAFVSGRPACGFVPAAPGMDGASLLPVIQHDTALRDAVVSEYYDYGIPERMLRTERWKYVHSHVITSRRT